EYRSSVERPTNSEVKCLSTATASEGRVTVRRGLLSAPVSGLRALAVGIVQGPLPHPRYAQRVVLAEVLHHEPTPFLRIPLRQIAERDVLSHRRTVGDAGRGR